MVLGQVKLYDSSPNPDPIPMARPIPMIYRGDGAFYVLFAR